LDEISSLPNDSPFSSLITVKFAINPASLSWTEASVSDPLLEDPYFYHKFYLERVGFVLDTDPVSNLISKDFEIEYSWGKPYYNFAQYVHTSGTVICQTLGDGDIVFFINTIFLCRVTAAAPSASVASISRSMPLPVDVIDSARSLATNERLLAELFDEAKRTWLADKLDLDESELEVGVPGNYASYYE
jgi:hypothetical protein